MESLATVNDDDSKSWGIRVGRAAAQILLAVRAHDGSDASIPYPGGTDPGQWRPTPPAFVPDTQAHFPLMTPFAITSSAQFRPPAPPALTSAEYAAAFNEEKSLGAVNSTTRTRQQTVVALLWELPVNGIANQEQIAQRAALAQGTSLADNARLFALLNMSLNDTLECTFESKFYYGLWRPVTAVQHADEDGNPDTEADPNWAPLINTPPYPTYAGNAAGLSTSTATILTSFFGTNDIPFDINWETFNVTRSYAGFQQAAQETADSRIWGGIHFRFDNVAGQAVGTSVAHYVFDHFLTALGNSPPPRGSGHPDSPSAVAPLSLAVAQPAPFSLVLDGGSLRVAPVQAVVSQAYSGAATLSSTSVRNGSTNGQGWQTVHAQRSDLVHGLQQGWGESVDLADNQDLC